MCIVPLLFSCSSAPEDEGGDAANNAADSPDPIVIETGADCDALCAKFETCDSSTDESDCVEECEGDHVVSAALWQAYGDCVDETSCNALESQEFFYCVLRGASDAQPTEVGTQFCDDYANRLEVCVEVDEDELRSACDDELVVLFSDAFIGDLSQCLDESCDRIDQCIIDEFDLADVPEQSFDGEILFDLLQYFRQRYTEVVDDGTEQANNTSGSDTECPEGQLLAEVNGERGCYDECVEGECDSGFVCRSGICIEDF